MAGLQVFSRDLCPKKGRHISRADLFLSLFRFHRILIRYHYRFSSQLPSSRTNQPSGVMRFANMIPFVPSETGLK